MPAQSHFDFDKIIEYLIDYKAKHDGTMPPLRDFLSDFGVGRQHVNHYILPGLVARGYIRIGAKGNTWHGVEIVGGRWLKPTDA